MEAYNPAHLANTPVSKPKLNFRLFGSTPKNQNPGVAKNPKQSRRLYLLLQLLVLVIIVAGAGLFFFTSKDEKTTTDTRSQADTSDQLFNPNAFSINFDGQNFAISDKTYQKMTLSLSLVGPKAIKKDSTIRIFYPNTAGLMPSKTGELADYALFDWTMSQPGNDLVVQSESEDLVANKKAIVSHGLLNDPQFNLIPYIDVVFLQDTIVSKIDVIVPNTRVQQLIAPSVEFKVAFDDTNTGSFKTLAKISFSVRSKGADSAKLLVDSFWNDQREFYLHVTPVQIENLFCPQTDEAFKGQIVLKAYDLQGNERTQEVTCLENCTNTNSEIVIKVTPQENCKANCVTQKIKLQASGKSSLFFKSVSLNANTISDANQLLSNPVTGKDFLAGTAFANSNVYWADWHSHYTDINSKAEDHLKMAVLANKLDVYTATLKTRYENYSTSDQTSKEMYAQVNSAQQQVKTQLGGLPILSQEWNQRLAYSNIWNSEAAYDLVPKERVWVDNVMLFPSNQSDTFYSLIDQATIKNYSNYWYLIDDVRSKGGVIIHHHTTSHYPWQFFDHTVNAAMRAYGFGDNALNNLDASRSDNSIIANLLLEGGKFGFVGESDSHVAMPGGEGAVTGIWAPSLQESDIFKAIKKRNIFATSALGRPIATFEMVAPMAVPMGREATIQPDKDKQARVFRSVGAFSYPIEQVLLVKGYQGSNTKATVTEVCPEAKGKRRLDCTYQDSSTSNFYYVYIVAGGGKQVYLSSPIWLNSQNLKYDYADNGFNKVSGYGNSVTLKTRFVLTKGFDDLLQTKNIAIFLSSIYPSKDTIGRKGDFNVLNSQDTTVKNWYPMTVERPEYSVDFKVRLADGGFSFVGLDYQKQCANPSDKKCWQVFGQAKTNAWIYMNTDGNYSNTYTKCTQDNKANCTYAGLDLSNSTIETKVDSNGRKVIDVTWAIKFEEIIGEKMYRVYVNSLYGKDPYQNWRRVGTVLANPSNPNGEVKFDSVVNKDGQKYWQFQLVSNTLGDNFSPVKNDLMFMRATVRNNSESCNSAGSAYYSVYGLKKTGSKFQIKVNLPGSVKNFSGKLCYYFVSLSGLFSETKTLDLSQYSL